MPRRRTILVVMRQFGPLAAGIAGGCAVVTGLIATSGLARRLSAQAAQTSNQKPAFTSRVDVVELDVSVLDKNRRPVQGLTAKDFTIFEDNKPVTIVACDPIDLADETLTATTRAPAAKWATESSPDVTTNTFDDRRLFILVMDDAMTFDDILMTRGAKDIAHQVIDRLGPADMMSVIFTRDNRATQDFTSDKVKLNAAVDRFSPGTVYMSGFKYVPPPLAGQRANRPEPIDSDSLYYEMSVRTVMNVADYLAAVPHRRKALVYISAGVSVRPAKAADVSAALAGPGGGAKSENRAIHQHLLDEMNDTFERAQRANVAVYAFDPSPNGAEDALVRFAASQGIGSIGSEKLHAIGTLDDDFLLAAASNTGGRAVLRGVDATAGIDQMFTENRSYYLLGYRATSTKTDSFHHVQVKINRPGSFDVRARNNYYVEKPPDPKRGLPTEETKALAGLLPDTGISLEVTAAPFARSAGPGETNPVALVIDVRQPAPETRTAEKLDLLTRAFTPEGTPRGSHAETVTLTLRPAETPGDIVEYQLLSQMDLAPGRYELRCSLHNGTLDKTGSVYADLVVPDFAKAPLSLSGVTINVSPAVPAAPRDGLASLVPEAPTTTRTFGSDAAVSAFVRVYEGGKDPLVAASISIRVLDDHDAVVIDAPRTIGAASFSTARATDLTFAVPVDRLSPGDYDLAIAVTAGKATARRDVRFSVK